jgi:hypothetical protein
VGIQLEGLNNYYEEYNQTTTLNFGLFIIFSRPHFGMLLYVGR